MAKITGKCKEVLDCTEWIAIATAGAGGPHVVATWGDYVRALGITDTEILIPVGGMKKTQANLERDSRVELLCGCRKVRGTHGPGKGCCITGTAVMQTTGAQFNAAKAAFSWVRAVLVVKVETVAEQL